MANATGILSATTAGRATPDVARRTWPRWLALGVGMIGVAVVAVVWEAAGARLLLGALGLFLVVRGVLLVRGARSGAVAGDLSGRARSLGTGAVVAGAAGLVVAGTSAALPATVLLVGAPVVLLAVSAGLLARGGAARRAGRSWRCGRCWSPGCSSSPAWRRAGSGPRTSRPSWPPSAWPCSVCR